MPLSVGGAGDLSALAARLKAVDKTLDKEMRSGVTAAVEPLEDAIRAQAQARMPGAYGPVLSRSLQFRISQRSSGSGFTVTMTTTAQGRANARLVRPLDSGQLRHPLYGNRGFWYVTRVRRGFWSDPVKEGKAKVVEGAVDAMRKTVRKVAG